MDSSDLFPTKWLSAEDVGNREVDVIVEDARKETIGDDTKLVLYYVGFDKGHVLNKTNWKKIKDRLGTETDNWKNVKLVLYTALVPYKGEDVPALRLKFPETEPEKQKPADIFKTEAKPSAESEEAAKPEQPDAEEKKEEPQGSPSGSSMINDVMGKVKGEVVKK